MTPFETFQNTLERLSALVQAAQDQCRVGESTTTVDFKSLEDDIRLFCESLKNAPDPRARTLLPAMANLIAQLDTLARDLEDYQAELRD